MLINAFGLGASKDIFFTQDNQSGINHGESGNCTVGNHHPELDVFLATLSTGPVGFGDGVNDTNTTLLMRCCAADGKILKPSVAITPIDATWTQASASRKTPSIPKGPECLTGCAASASVWTAHSVVNGSYWHYAMAIDVPTSFQLVGTDLWPAVPSSSGGVEGGGAVMHRRWHAPACNDGMQASACGVVGGLPDVKTGIPAASSPIGAHNWELTTIITAVNGAGGIALLGELGKVVSVSASRFISVVPGAAGSAGLTVRVAGKPTEVVEIAFVVGGAAGTIVVKRASIGPSGAATVVVTSK